MTRKTSLPAAVILTTIVSRITAAFILLKIVARIRARSTSPQ